MGRYLTQVSAGIRALRADIRQTTRTSALRRGLRRPGLSGQISLCEALDVRCDSADCPLGAQQSDRPRWRYVDFPSLKARQLLAILEREPLAYECVRQRGSHRRLVSRNSHPPLTFSFHDRVTIPPGLVRKILVKDVGLTEDEAAELAST